MLKYLRISFLIVVLYASLSMVILWPIQASLVKEGRDIRQDYLGSQRLFEKIDLYSRFSPAEFESIQVVPELGMPLNFHPPTTLIFFAYLTVLNFKYAVLAWGFISLLAFFASLYLIMREIGYQNWFFLSLAMVIWFPLWLHIRFGQFSIHTLLFLTLFWISMKKKKPAAASLFLSLACLVKLFPLYILLLLILKKQWRIVIYSLFIMGIITIAMYLYYPDSIISFITKVAPANDAIFRTYFGNFSFNGFVGRLFNGTAGISPLFNSEITELIVRYSGIILLVLLSVIFALRINQFDFCFSLYIVVMLILSPTTWAHSFVLLLIPAFIILGSFNQSRDRTPKSFFIFIFLLSCFPHWQYYEWILTISPGQLLPGWLLFTSPGFYVLIGMLILCVWQGKIGSNQPHVVG